MKKLAITCAVIFLSCLAVSSAQALMFSSLDWSGLGPTDDTITFLGTTTGLGYDITFYAPEGRLTWNPDDGGVGVNNDEITGPASDSDFGQAIVMEFSREIWMSSFTLVDLFYEGNPAYLESGEYFYANSGLGGSGAFQADPAQIIGITEGLKSLAINDWVTAIAFIADFPGSKNDYALAGYSAVPEPPTALLLGILMIGLAGIGRKKFNKR